MSKKTEQLNVSLTPYLKRKLNGNYRRNGIKPTDFARSAIVEKLSATQLPKIDPSEADALAKARDAGVDPVAVLLKAAEANITNGGGYPLVAWPSENGRA